MAQSTAALTQALETSYKYIRQLHPELPDDLIIIVSPTSRSGKNTKLGHFARNSWLDREGADELLNMEDEPTQAQRQAVTRFHEILLSAEGLYRGGEGAMETLLHECAHLLAQVRGQKDVTGYQYHNRTFKANAEEIGLTVAKLKNRGFAHTDMTDQLREKYALQILLLNGVVKAIRAPQPKTTKANNGQVKMACACGNIIRCERGSRPTLASSARTATITSSRSTTWPRRLWR
jgi:hypothetical protein